jgi:hypothetical protein
MRGNKVPRCGKGVTLSGAAALPENIAYRRRAPGTHFSCDETTGTRDGNQTMSTSKVR